MSERIKRNICVTIIILIQCFVVIFWASKKERFNVDEVFSYEGAKSGGYGKQYWDNDIENFYGKNYTKSDFEEHITINSEDLLIQKPAELCDALVHRNTYYTMLNLAATFTAGKLTKWTGIGLNLIFFVLMQIIFYRFTLRRCNSFRCAILAILLYGFSAGGISTVLYMRCYMILTLLLMLACFCYVKCIEGDDWRYKLLYLICALINGVACVKIHPFGMLFFAIMSCGMIVYILIYKYDKRLLVGLGIMAIIGIPICTIYVMRNMSNLVEVFKGSVGGITGKELILRSKCVFEIISEHLWYKSLFFTIIAITIVYSVVKKRRQKENNSSKKLGIILGLSICCYLIILILGGALAWKYVCITYPFIFWLWIFFSDIQKFSQKAFVTLCVVLFGITGISYYNRNISELFLGELSAERFFEEKYGDVNGVMIHADTAGENWLYEAAYLWPQNANVNVQILSAMRDVNKLDIQQNEDDEILLWLTIDYDNKEVIELFMEKTPFRQYEMVYMTDSLRVYMCKK